MDSIENLVQEGTENVEGTTTEEIVDDAGESKEPEKIYSEGELNTIVNQKIDELLPRKLERQTAKIRKEYEKKYGDLESVLKAGTGKERIEEVTESLKKFYEDRGVQIPKTSAFSDKDISVLAKAEAADIIKAGIDDVIEEVDRLADIGVGKMTPREKAVFKELAEYRQSVEQNKELEKIGVTEAVYASAEFKEFAKQFNSGTPITTVYDIYSKMQPKKEVKTIGSMKSTQADTGVKDFYTRDEALKFTKKDFDKNPALFKAVEKSMLRWK